MFAEHQPQLSRLGRASPDGLLRIATFALCTIRQPLRIACADYKLVRSGDTGSLFGAKHAGLAYLGRHAPELWEACEYAYETADDDTASNLILSTLSRVPMLGPAKAGFVTQMVYGLSGCVDTHNLARFDLPLRHFEVNKRNPNRVRAIVRDYNAFCRKVGGTAALWDGWCQYLAERDPVNYPSAERVSKLHLVPLEC